MTRLCQTEQLIQLAEVTIARLTLPDWLEVTVDHEPPRRALTVTARIKTTGVDDGAPTMVVSHDTWSIHELVGRRDDTQEMVEYIVIGVIRKILHHEIEEWMWGAKFKGARDPHPLP